MRITVDVKVESREERVEKLGEGWFLVRVKAPRKKGKANIAVIKLLRRYFDCSVHIVSGFTSSRKIIELQDKQAV